MERSGVLLVLCLCAVDAQFVSFDRFLNRNRPDQITTKPRFLVLAPDVLKADSEQNLVFQVDGVSTPVQVSVQIWDHTRSILLHHSNTSLSPDSTALHAVQLSSENLSPKEKVEKFVFLKVTFEGFPPEERLLLVSFHRGFIFLQTDKPIYNPGEKVLFRAYVSSPGFQALEGTIRVDVRNPDGIVVWQTGQMKAVKAIFKGNYDLAEIANEGLWTVTARFDHREENSFNSTFEVKRYVLPAFNVSLTPEKPFFSIDDSELVLTLTARYLYGQPVQGKAYIMFGIKHDKEKIRLRAMKQITDLDGGKVSLTLEDLKAEFPNVRILVGKSIYVKASVLTDSGGDLVEVERGGIRVVISPFVLSFRDAPRFFKPGLPLELTLDVRHHDGSPVTDVQVKMTFLEAPVNVVGGVAYITVNMPLDKRIQEITAETVQPGLRPEQQTRKTLYVQPYQPFRDALNLLYVSGVSRRVAVGDNIALMLRVTTENPEHRQHVRYVTYMVLNKGRIVKVTRVDVASQVATKVQVAVTPDLLPSFRVVAFYTLPWSRGDEVVADSVYVDVEDTCVSKVSVLPAGRFDHLMTPMPGDTLRLKVQGEAGATVSMVAVDNSVFLLRKERLTQSKIWNVVEQSDLGCARGGGSSAKGVFSDAGLMFYTNTGFKTNARQKLQCQHSSRGRRSAAQIQRKEMLEGQYRDELLRRCCVDGLRRIPMPYSCTRRSLYITEGVECIRAFRHCCGTYHGEPIDPHMPTAMPGWFYFTTTTPTTTTTTAAARIALRPDMFDWGGRARMFSQGSARAYDPVVYMPAPREEPAAVGLDMDRLRPEVPAEVEAEVEPEDVWEEVDEDEVDLRSQFLESWLWEEVNLPASATGVSSVTLERPLQDSITEWGILAVSTSSHTGFCVAEPYNVRTWKPLFVELKFPYSVARNEQIQIKAVIHNYSPVDQQVRVTLMKTESMCSVAFRDRHVQDVRVSSGGSVMVPYTVVPQVVGLLPIEVMVVTKDNRGTDRVRRELRVVTEGVQKTKVWSVVLNPAAEGGTQTLRMGKVELESIVPNSVPHTVVNLRGCIMADSLENALQPDALAALIRMPGGCVEQNLASMSLPTIAFHFLELSKDWARVGVQRRDEALGYIRQGYSNQLAYRREDGSYPPYKKLGASTWITAFVVKVFSMAHSVVGVDEQQVCEAVRFLQRNRYNPELSAFYEETPVYSPTLTGGLRGDDPQVTLTAFVLIALAEAQQVGISCSPNDSPEGVVLGALGRLKAALRTSGRRPYTVAIASYALALHRDKLHFNPIKDLMVASADGKHWADRENPLFSLEATGYALLALVKMNAMKEAEPVFKWLTNQRRLGGGYGSTQPTVVVLQALAQYLLKAPPQGLDLDVELRMGARTNSYNFNPDTSYAARSARLLDNSNLEVQARGTGQGILEVVTYYNRLLEEEEKTPCGAFELRVTIEELPDEPPPDTVALYLLSVSVRSLKGSDLRMVVLDVTLPTGFTAENSDLDMLSQSVDKYIAEFKTVDNLSDRGSLILHLFKVSHREPEILIFKLKQNFKVGLIQPSSVTAYQYYNPDERCSRSFTPRERTEQLAQICSDNVCRCTQGDCGVTKKDSENFSSQDREAFACATLHHVFRAKVLSLSQSYYDRYELQITQVIKEGAESAVFSGQTRTFLSHGACRDGLRLIPGQDYLIIGPRDDMWSTDSATNRVEYLLGKNTWVERWPSVEECGAGLRQKCESLSATAHQLSTTGCRL